jgi:hypothetical protein
VDESDPDPSAVICIPRKVARKLGKDPSDLRRQLLSRAKTLLAPNEFDRCVDTDSTEGSNNVDNAQIFFHILSACEILDLINPDEGQGLVQALVKQFDVMATLVPALDEIFGTEPHVK